VTRELGARRSGSCDYEADDLAERTDAGPIDLIETTACADGLPRSPSTTLSVVEKRVTWGTLEILHRRQVPDWFIAKLCAKGGMLTGTGSV